MQRKHLCMSYPKDSLSTVKCSTHLVIMPESLRERLQGNQRGPQAVPSLNLFFKKQTSPRNALLLVCILGYLSCGHVRITNDSALLHITNVYNALAMKH